MKEIAFFDTKPYEQIWFDKLNNSRYKFRYIDSRLTFQTAILANGCEGVIAFVNDNIDKKTIENLYNIGIKVIALRSAGYNNVDFKSSYKKITVLRVPKYSPYAVAEHAFAMILCLNRKIHKAYNRTREFNFSISGLVGYDLYGKTVGVIGTGKIGQVFVNIAKGFGMNIVAYDSFPQENLDINYVDKDELFEKSDIISLHCPLTPETKHLINKGSISKMKDGVCIINTSRGALIDAKELLNALRSGKIGSAGLDVYEEEANWFFEDKSQTTNQDEILSQLVVQPNVIVTSHQAFFTNEALKNIAEITLNNLDDYFGGKPLENEICYHCIDNPKINCKKINGRCF